MQTIIANGRICSENIQNYTANGVRRVEVEVQIDYSTDAGDAIEAVYRALGSICNVLSTPEPCVAVKSFTLAGPLLTIRVFTEVDHHERRSPFRANPTTTRRAEKWRRTPDRPRTANR